MFRFISPLFVGLSVITLAACSSGGGQSSPPTPGPSSSSSSSSGAISANCPESSCVLFDDGMLEGRGTLAAFEWLASNTGGFHYDGDQPSHVEWQLVNNAERGQVVQVTFNGNDPDELVNDNGWFGIVADTDESNTVDLSAFSNGAVSFDMRILQNGTNTDELDFKMECIYPCTSGEIWVADPAELDEWETRKIPMRQLIESGLDITKVNNIFIFKPTWGRQAGQYVIELDNIRLDKTYTPEPPPAAPTTAQLKVFYENGAAADSGFAITNAQSGMFMELSDGISTYINIYLHSDNPPSEFFIFPQLEEGNEEASTFDMSEYYFGEIVFDLQVVSYGANLGEFLVNSFCKWPCRAVPAYSIGRPTEGSWQTHRVPVEDLVENGLRLDRIQNGLHLKFDGTGHQGLEINLNNIRWEYTPAE